MASEGRKRMMGAKRLGVKDVTYAQWIAEPSRYATREQIVAFTNLFFKEEIIPVVAEIIKRAIDGYHERELERKWYRRLWRFLKAFVVRDAMSVENLPPEARQALRDELDKLEPREMPKDDEPPLDLERAEPEAPAQAGPISCVVCGSRTLDRWADGKVQCTSCKAILVDSPAAETAMDLTLRLGGEVSAREVAKPGPEPVENSIPGENKP